MNLDAWGFSTKADPLLIAAQCRWYELRAEALKLWTEFVSHNQK